MKKITRHKLGPPRPVQHSQLVDREQRLSDCPIIKPPDQHIEDHAKIRRRQHPIHSSTRYSIRLMSRSSTTRFEVTWDPLIKSQRLKYLRERVRLLQAYEKFSGDWSIRDLKNRALSERIALLKELQSVGDVNFDERQIKDRIRAIRDIRARQEQKAALVERNAHVASIHAELEESEAARSSANGAWRQCRAPLTDDQVRSRNEVKWL